MFIYEEYIPEGATTTEKYFKYQVEGKLEEYFDMNSHRAHTIPTLSI